MVHSGWALSTISTVSKISLSLLQSLSHSPSLSLIVSLSLSYQESLSPSLSLSLSLSLSICCSHPPPTPSPAAHRRPPRACRRTPLPAILGPPVSTCGRPRRCLHPTQPWSSAWPTFLATGPSLGALIRSETPPPPSISDAQDCILELNIQMDYFRI
jgi:hypothetical protein